MVEIKLRFLSKIKKEIKKIKVNTEVNNVNYMKVKNFGSELWINQGQYSYSKLKTRTLAPNAGNIVNLMSLDFHVVLRMENQR